MVTFWDSSAFLPLLLPEPTTANMHRLFREARLVAVWHWTPVELMSAIERRRREGVDAAVVQHAADGLRIAAESWTEIADHDLIRSRARRCLRLHPLRAADAGQLAAALTFVDRFTDIVQFVTLDQRLADVARLEGLTVIP